MNEAIEKVYDAILKAVGDLIELDPDPDTPEGRLLLGLSTACEIYEKAIFDLDTTEEGKDNATI
jgi:hypothetical protein